MSIYANLNCLLNAVRSNNANEVAFIIRHSPDNFVSNPYLEIAIEEGNIAAGCELLKRWHPFYDLSLSSLIDLVDDPTFARSAIEKIGREILPFDQLIVQAARLGRECWVKELARLTENKLWGTSGFQAEIDFWKKAAHEDCAVLQLLLKHMLVNLEALEPALQQAQQHHAQAAPLLLPFVQRLKRIDQARKYAADQNVEALTILVSTMPPSDIREAYCEAHHDARLPSVWLAAVPTLEGLEYSIPWLLSTALRHNDMVSVSTLWPRYRVVEEKDREERKHEPNLVISAIENPVGLKFVLGDFPVDHPHIVSAMDAAAGENNLGAVQQLLDHNPQLLTQALLSSLSAQATKGNTAVSDFLLNQCSDHELAMCVRLMDKKKMAFSNMQMLLDVIEPRMERWRINQHIDIPSPTSAKRKL